MVTAGRDKTEMGAVGDKGDGSDGLYEGEPDPRREDWDVGGR